MVGLCVGLAVGLADVRSLLGWPSGWSSGRRLGWVEHIGVHGDSIAGALEHTPWLGTAERLLCSLWARLEVPPLRPPRPSPLQTPARLQAPIVSDGGGTGIIIGAIAGAIVVCGLIAFAVIKKRSGSRGDGEKGDKGDKGVYRESRTRCMYEENGGGKKDGFGFGAEDAQGYLEVDGAQTQC